MNLCPLCVLRIGSYGAKNPEISSTKCERSGTNALIEALVVETMAIFDVIAPSPAFKVEASGCAAPCGQSVRNPSGAGGTTVLFSTNACAVAGMPQPLPATSTLRVPLNGCEPEGFLVSRTRQGFPRKSDSPPAPAGAKYPSMSITKSVLLVTNTEMSPLAPAGTMAALAVTVPVGAFSVETRGCVCPVGQVVRNPKFPFGTEV